MSNYLWITWEWQRRSIELAQALMADLKIVDDYKSFRYIRCIIKSILLIKNNKHSVLFVQNPSMVLAFLAILILKPIFSIPVIVDRHSNFLLTAKKRNFIKELLFQLFSYLTIRYADLTIVTNDDLSHVIRVLGGRPFVLPDKIPSLITKENKTLRLSGNKNILVISSFSDDEPIEEICNAFQMNEMSAFNVYISGNSSKKENIKNNIAENIILTGFLPELDFVSLIYGVDAVIVLTKMEYTLLCGCYEAISAEKPLITSNTEVLRNFFHGAMFVENNATSIANGIKSIFHELPKYELNAKILKNQLIKNWNSRFEKLQSVIKEIDQNYGSSD